MLRYTRAHSRRVMRYGRRGEYRTADGLYCVYYTWRDDSYLSYTGYERPKGWGESDEPPRDAASVAWN